MKYSKAWILAINSLKCNQKYYLDFNVKKLIFVGIFQIAYFEIEVQFIFHSKNQTHALVLLKVPHTMFGRGHFIKARCQEE